MKNFINQNITAIIRSVGERTENLCYELARKQIDEENIHIIRETPFSEAVRKTFEVGIRENRKWTLVLDADVLVRAGVVEDLVGYAENMEDNVFEIEGKIIDKFLFSLNPREGGIHFYRTTYMTEALQYIPKPQDAIRPEFLVKNAMQAQGRPWRVIDLVVGVHDFEQFYRDIYRKCFIQAKKHFVYVEKMLPQWVELSENDPDFQVAVAGFKAGAEYDKAVSIDKNSAFMIAFDKTINNLGLAEKDRLDSADFFDEANRHKYRDIFAVIDWWPFSVNYMKQNIKGVGNYVSAGITDKGYLEELRKANRHCRTVEIDNLKNLKNSLIDENRSTLLDIDSGIIDVDFYNELEELAKKIKDLRLAIHFNISDDAQRIKSEIGLLSDSGLDVYCFNDTAQSVAKIESGVNDDLIDDSINDRIMLYCNKKEYCYSVVYFVHSAIQSGAERSAFENVKTLISKYGLVATMVIPHKGPMESNYNAIGVPVIIIDYIWWAGNKDNKDILTRKLLLLESMKNVLANKSLIENINPDLVYTQTIVFPWGALLAALLKKPHIWNVREYGELDHGLQFLFPFSDVIDIIKNFSSFVTTSGKSLKAFLFSDLPLEKVKVAYSHIDLKSVKNLQKQEHREAIECILPGNIAPGKGQLEAVMAVSELVHLRKRDNIKLKIIGTGSDAYPSQIRSFIENHGLADKVSIQPFDPDIERHIQSSDIVLNCSRCEAFGRVPVEGLLLEKPVIASNAGGNTEIVFDKENGFLYEQGNAADLADKIEYFLDNPEETERMGSNGPEVVKRVMSDHFAEDVLYHASLRLKGEKIVYDGDMFIDLVNNIIKLENHFLQTLFIDTGKGFNGSESLREVTGKGHDNAFSVNFQLSGFSDVQSLRFDPLEGEWCKVRLDSVVYQPEKQDNVALDISRITANGRLQKDGYVVFDTFDPVFVVPVSGKIEQIEIHGRIEILSNQHINMLIQEKSRELQKRNQIIQEKSRELQKRNQIIQEKSRELQKRNQAIEALKNSYTWKAGRALAWLPEKLISKKRP